MNQDQVKARLLELRGEVEDFTVVFSGKSSRKVNGLYKSASREILIHNRNFQDDNALMYTAIHEFAHHLQFTSDEAPRSARAHTTGFWSLLHTLLIEAERKGIYRNVFTTQPEFVELTETIRRDVLSVNGRLMKDLGALLMRAMELCERFQASFGDYLDRVLNLPRPSADLIVKAHTMDLKPEIGFENMRTVARIRDPEAREAAQEALLDGESSYMVKKRFLGAPEAADPLDRLQAERERLERQIDTLRRRLREVEKKIAAVGADSVGAGAVGDA